MEGERILQKILKGECRQLQDLKNFTAPFEKFLGDESPKCMAKKAFGYEKISKYGAFCIKLLRCCVEALSKRRKQENGNPIQEDCFKCAVLGADILSKLITSGIVLPPEISISTITKLFFHLIINALKEDCTNYLVPITCSLVNITQTVMKSGHDNIIKESQGLCKQLSNHLWNAAIKLPKTMDKLKRNLLALSLREKSIDLLFVAKQDVDFIIERGLLSGKKFQLEVCDSSQRQEGKILLLSILSNVVPLLDSGLSESVQLYSKLEDLCITCCELSITPSHIQEVVKSFNCLVKTDAKNNASRESRFSVFQHTIQILLCALSFRLKNVKELDNHKYELDLKWNAVQKRLASTTEAMGSLDSNLYMESRIHLAMDYLRCTLSEIFRTTSNNLVKIPAEILSALYDLLFVCYSIQSHLAKKTVDQCISNTNTWKMNVQPKLAMLYLISTVLEKKMNSGSGKTSYYGRKNGVKHDYVAIMIEGMKTIDDVIEETPAAIDQYGHYAFFAFNIGLILHNCSQVNDASSLARLACEAGTKWYLAHSEESNAISKAKLHNKYELLSDCLKKQGHWLESLRTMGLCCQYYMLSIDDKIDEKASDYVLKWSKRKYNAIKELNDKEDVHKIQRCNLDDNCKDYNGPSLKEEQVCAFLRMELECYRKKRYCTPFDQLCVVEKLLNLYLGLEDETNAFLMRLEKVKVMYHMAVQLDDGISSISDGLLFCEDLIEDINEMLLHKQPGLFKVKDILASAYFWSFILKYSIAVQQTKEDMKECTNDACKENERLTNDLAANLEKAQSLSMTPDFLHALNLAVNEWTELITEGVKKNSKLGVCSQSETCWMLQIASSVYGFLNLTLIRIHTLLVLATFATLCGDDESLETVVVANSLAIQALCDEGNTPAAELLRNKADEILSTLGVNFRPSTRYSFSLAKSQLFLCKGLHDEGWQLVQAVLNEAKENSGITMQFLLLKAKLLCVRYLSLPVPLFKVKGTDDSNYFDYLSESTKYVDTLVKHFIENGAGNEIAGLNDPKKERVVFLSHWSLLRELSCCYAEIGKVYLLQGALRESKRFLEDGRKITKRYLSAKRYSLFTLELAELYTVWDMAEMSQAYLEDALGVVKPNVSLLDMVNKTTIFEVEKHEDSVFGSYESVSYAQLYIKLYHCYCQYLKLNGNGSEVKKAVSLSHDLRQNSVKLYRHALVNQERMFAVAYGTNCDESIAELPCPDGKRNTKAKGKRVKATTKQSGKVTSELNADKADIASLVFVESCLKTYALDADNALMERDYSRLLSNVQAGLDMVQWAQGIVSDPFLLDLMSTSLLHYLHGVAQVLASSNGFDSWKVVGGAPPLVTNVADVSEEMWPLDLSVTPVKPSRKSRRGLTNSKKECFDVLFCDDILTDQKDRVENISSHPTSVDSKTKKKARNGRILTTEEPSSLARSKKTPASRKVMSSIPQTPLASGKETDDVTTERGLKGVKKDSRSSRKNTKEVSSKGSTKSKEDCERDILFDVSKPQRKEREEIKRKSTKSSRDIEQCDQTEEELHQRKGMDENGGIFDGTIEKDKDMTSALDSFNSSLQYLYPCYNSILLTRTCHALVLCHGSKSPEKAAVFQNMAMATTLHHQTLNRSTKKIRKEKEKQMNDRNESNHEDELVKLLESVTLGNAERKSIKQLLQLQTIKKTVAFTKSAGDALECFKNTIDLLPEGKTE
ncbi:uncharacterized protein LOC114518975 [Dendronephthya gigantea]|uniref:uncharacterized protein LOC114518975 n=1 Tax=Dendronephthya gigantea TaxID=151771 RepID=UPI00106B7B0D|nr:uncharacterized protein LOC114518975 [Dendronephthya gigantea]